MPDWLIPWIIIAVVIWPLVKVEEWIHWHIQGLGLLITDNRQAATLIYYLVLLPGVVLHEVSQWVLAQVLRVKVKKFQLWPDTQGKRIRLGLVEIDKKTDDYRATAVGMVPLVSGVTALVLIGQARFDVHTLFAGLGTGDLPTAMAAIRTFTSAPDFWIWVYLAFAIANAMLPEEHDRVNWWLFIVPMAGISAVLLLLDLGILLEAWLDGPLTAIGEWLSFGLALALGFDLFMMALIAIAEEVIGRFKENAVEY